MPADIRLLTIVAAIAGVAFALWLVQHLRRRLNAGEREAYYQKVLAKYIGEVKPGMTREQVEQHLQADGRQFRQMCCAANSRGQYVSFREAGWDDLLKIGQESAPCFCSEHSRVHCILSLTPSHRAICRMQIFQMSSRECLFFISSKVARDR